MEIEMHRNRPYLDDTAIYHATDQHAIANDRLTAPFFSIRSGSRVYMQNPNAASNPHFSPSFEILI